MVMMQRKADIFTLDKLENDSVKIQIFCYDLRRGNKARVKGYIWQAEVQDCFDATIASHIRLGKKICNIVIDCNAYIGLDEKW